MKRPLTDYGFWTYYSTGRWSTYFTIPDHDDYQDKPVGEEGHGDAPESSLAQAVGYAIYYDDGRCKHNREPDWCPICEEDAEIAMGRHGGAE